MTLSIAEIAAGRGHLALSPMPGRSGRYHSDLRALLAWGPDLVITMTPQLELAAKAAETLPQDLADFGILWHHLPIDDFGVPTADITAAWPITSDKVKEILGHGGKVLIHCMGGCGRSGMVALRLLIELGEAPEAALIRLRKTRPCAVETEAQYLWASS